MKTVRTFGNLADAGFASSLLEAGGIKSLLADEQSFTIGYGAATGGLRVQVDDADLERALRVLDQGPDAPVVQQPEPTPESGNGVPLGVFVAGVVTLAVLAFAGYQLKQGRYRTGMEPEDQTYEFDTNHDGKSDRFTTYRRGYVASSTMDRNFDDKADEWEFYDRDGIIQRAEQDQNFDGTVDDWFTYKNGAVESSKCDTDFNGVADCVTTYVNGIAARRVTMPEPFGR